MSRAINESGNVYGRLTVVARSVNVGTAANWLCKCRCGEWHEVTGGNLRSGDTLSCGCYKAESVKARGIAARAEEPRELRRWLIDGASSGPCADCGMWPEDPCQMDFHHLYDKSFSLGGAWKTHSIDEIVREIGKCQLLCASCHRLWTKEERLAAKRLRTYERMQERKVA